MTPSLMLWRGFQTKSVEQWDTKTSSLERRYYVQAELTDPFYANTKIFLSLIQILGI